MSKKILIGGGMALVALVVAVASMLLFAKVQPTEAEVRAAVEMALPEKAVVDQMTFAVFSDDRSKGRVSVKGTYSFDHDIFSLPTPPVKLMKSLSAAQVFENDLSRWWSENSSFYPQFKGKLGEFRKMYSSGEGLEFSGELPFLAVVDGTKVDSSSLAYVPIEGTAEPAFGYADDSAKASELATTIIEWRDRRRDEAAVAEAARAAEAEAAAVAAAKVAADEAAAEAKAYEARIVAEAVAAAAAQAAAEAEAARNRPLTSAAFTTKTVGKFEPFIVKSGERVGPITLYKGTCPYWYKSGLGMIAIFSRSDLTAEPAQAVLTEGYGIERWGHEGPAKEMYFEAQKGDIQIELERRDGGNSCK